MIDVVTIETPGLGDRSYLITDGRVAVVVDPQRDIDRVQRVLDDRALRLTHVLETHVHNDYVTGGLELARASGARYVVAADEPVDFERVGVREGDEITSGGLHLRPLHTPGHTPHHLSYAIADEVAGELIDRFVLTGGSLLHGSVGRTDLIDPSRTDELTRAQHRSARRLLDELGGTVAVLPTHGFGSFCSSTSSTESSDGTIAGERDVNQAARIGDEDTFVATIISGLTAYPSYYERMAPINRSGPPPIDLSAPPAVHADGVAESLRRGDWIVDLRSRRAFAEQHVAGTVNVGLDGGFATYLGWVLPWRAPLILLGAEADHIAAAQRELVRIGVDRPAGGIVGGPEAVASGARLHRYVVADFPGLAKALGTAAGGVPPVVVDVRRDDEWRDGHIDGAVHIPLPDLADRAARIPEGELWVHCASGYRSAIGASLLARAGREVVLVDDDFSNAADSLPVI
ncbi:MBL fold metallo-hydrolase [soil metagenome]